MLLNITLFFRRMRWLLSNRFGFVKYTVGATPAGFKRSLMRTHNQRRERGNVALRLGQRRGRYNATR
jgi:hypothetical protein